MQNIFQIIIGRILGRFIGLNTRYLFYKLLGKEKAYDELSKPVIVKGNKYDFEGLQQDIYNAIVGALVIIFIVVVIIVIL